jgi:hypothetical protein
MLRCFVNLHKSTPNGKPIRTKPISHNINKWKSGSLSLQKLFLPVSLHYRAWVSIKTHRTYCFVVSYFFFSNLFLQISLTLYQLSFSHCPPTQLSVTVLRHSFQSLSSDTAFIFLSSVALEKSLLIPFLSFLWRHFSKISFPLFNVFIS